MLFDSVSGCDPSEPVDAAHTRNPEVQASLADYGYAYVPRHASQNDQIELQCRQLIELRHKQK